MLVLVSLVLASGIAVASSSSAHSGFDASPLRPELPAEGLTINLSQSSPLSGSIIVDHTCTDLDTIPDSAIQEARKMSSVLRHASVGNNISAGLDDLQSMDGKYDRANLRFSNRGNPGWQAKVDDLDTYVAQHLSEYAIFAQKFCFIDVGADWTYYRDHMEALEATYPDKVFVWWTMPLMTDLWGPAWDEYNAAIRSYCLANDKILFDIADIESHDPAGNPVFSGVYEALYPGYTYDEGHLNETGRRRVAAAYWWLMARLAGWDGLAAEGSQKTATTETAVHGEVITYTVVIQDLDAPLSATVKVTDEVPLGLSYVTGSLTATAGVAEEGGAPVLRWSGVLMPSPVVTITYVVTASGVEPQVITNVAVIAVPGWETITRTATVWSNWYGVYLPLLVSSTHSPEMSHPR